MKSTNWLKSFALLFLSIGLLASCSQNKAGNESTEKEHKEFVKHPSFDVNVIDGIPMVIDFYATWCKPCKTIEPVFDSLQKEYSNKINFIRVDVDQQPEIAKEYNISAVPTFVFLDADDKELYRIEGADAKQLTNTIKELANY